MINKKVIAKKNVKGVLSGKQAMGIAKELLTQHVRKSLDGLGNNFFVNDIAKENAFTNLLYVFIDEEKEINSIILVEDDESSHYYSVSLVAREILGVF